MELEFQGDWSIEEAQAIARRLQKSLDMGDAIPSELSPPAIGGDWQNLLNHRQKKLVEQWKKAGKKAFCPDPDECPPEPEEYDAYVDEPKRKRQSKSADVLHKALSPTTTQLGRFNFPVTDGEFGEGVYFPVRDEGEGNLRLRVQLDVSSEQTITAEQFYQLESDLAANTSLILDGKDVRAIAKVEGDKITLLCIRHTGDIEPLGVLAGGSIPDGPLNEFRITRILPDVNHLLVDVEVGAAPPLTKTAFPAGNPLSMAPVVLASGPELDRVMVRDAIGLLKEQGMSFDGISVELRSTRPDFLPEFTPAYCYPPEPVIYLLPHNPAELLDTLVAGISVGLTVAVNAGMDSLPAFNLLADLAFATPMNWLKYLIGNSVGSIHCEQEWNIMAGGDLPGRYTDLLVGRGVEYWADRRLLIECMGNDYRAAFDPGLPNPITMLWDLLMPDYARMGQQTLLNLLGEQPLAKATIGQTKQVDGKTYTLNQNYRWQLNQNNKPGQAKGGMPALPQVPKLPQLKQQVKSKLPTKKQVQHAAVHEGDELGANIVSWKVGQLFGSAIGHYAANHGLNPLHIEMISAGVVQASTATGIYAVKQYRKNGHLEARDIGKYYVKQVAAAFLGKYAHLATEVSFEALGVNDMAQHIGPLLAGKVTGISTVVGMGRYHLDSRVFDAMVAKSQADIGLIKGYVSRLTNGLAKDAAGLDDATQELMWTLTQAGIVLAMEALKANEATN